MVTNVNYRMYNQQSPLIGFRQNVSNRSRTTITFQMKKILGLTVLIGFLVTCIVSQINTMRIHSAGVKMTELQAMKKNAANENMNLLVQRARLMSKKHIEKIAAVELQLYLPIESQVHKL